MDVGSVGAEAVVSDGFDAALCPSAPVRLPVAVIIDGSPDAIELVLDISGDLAAPGWAARVVGTGAGRVVGGDDLVLVLLAGRQAGEVARGRLHAQGAGLVVSGSTGFAG